MCLISLTSLVTGEPDQDEASGGGHIQIWCVDAGSHIYTLLLKFKGTVVQC